MLSPENNSSLEPNEISLLYVTVPENSIKSLVNLIFVFGQMEWYLSNLWIDLFSVKHNFVLVQFTNLNCNWMW